MYNPDRQLTPPLADVGDLPASVYAPLMQPFPPLQIVEVFQGDALAQVWLDPNGVGFIFESTKVIYAEMKVIQIEPNGTEWPYECVGHNGAPVVFHRLLYRRIVTVKREELRLTLRLEDGSALVICSEIGPYESGHLIMRKGDLTVF